MKCRVCNRTIDFVNGKRNGRPRLFALHHVPRQIGLNDHLISERYRRKLRVELEGTCKPRGRKPHTAVRR
jgi:hypothetical protein